MNRETKKNKMKDIVIDILTDSFNKQLNNVQLQFISAKYTIFELNV